MIKILNIITRMNIGGASLHVVTVSELLNEDGYRSAVLYGAVQDNEADMLYLSENKPLQMIYLPAMGRSINPLLDFKAIWQVYRQIRKFKPDIVHTHTAKAGFAGRLGAWLAGVPVIIHTFHGNNFSGYFGRFMSTVSILIERFMARISSAIIAISEQQRQELLKYRITDAKKIKVIPLGFDLNDIEHKPEDKGNFRKAWNISSDKHIIAFVGRLTAIKNPFLALDIASSILKQRGDIIFCFVGDGELANPLKEKVTRLGLGNRIIFTGFIKDLKPLYADSDILLLTSLNEGTPVTIIEAMVNRVLVLSSAVGGVPNLITHRETGLLCTSSTAEDYEKYILEYLRDPSKFSSIVENACHKAVETYSSARLKKDLKELFEHLMKGHQTRR